MGRAGVDDAASERRDQPLVRSSYWRRRRTPRDLKRRRKENGTNQHGNHRAQTPPTKRINLKTKTARDEPERNLRRSPKTHL